MVERVVGNGHITKIAQDEFDDGIQTLYITLSDGTVITQKREWPNLVYRGDASGDNVHDVYLSLTEGGCPPDVEYDMIRRLSRLIEGPNLTVDDATTATNQEGNSNAAE